MTTEHPELPEFLDMDIDQIKGMAPQTIIFANGGTRRRAVLQGFAQSNHLFVQRTRREMMTALELLFEHGIQHIVTTLFAESHYAEVTSDYREHLMRWTDWGIAGTEAMEDYSRLGWQVRLIGTESVSELSATSARLAATTPVNLNGPSVWFTVASEADTGWEMLFDLARRGEIRNRQDAVRALYGQDIPPASLYLGNGKPQILTSIAPPLLIGKMQCYWRQHLGFDLDERTVRTILYDYAYHRNTWSADRGGRADQALAYRAAWQDPPILGLGVRLGPFWFPAPIPEIEWDIETP